MQQGQVVLRNTISREDAVYIITVVLTDGRYTVSGSWGRWNAFVKSGKLQSKVYYDGESAHVAKARADELYFNKQAHCYGHVHEYDILFPWPWEYRLSNVVSTSPSPKSVSPSPLPKPVSPAPSPQPVSPAPELPFTRAGVLEWD